MKQKDTLFKGILLPLIGLSFLLYFSKPKETQITQQTNINQLSEGQIESNQSIKISATLYQETADYLVFIDLTDRDVQIRVDKWSLIKSTDLYIGKQYEIQGIYDGFQLMEASINQLKGTDIKSCIPYYVRELDRITEINCHGKPMAVDNSLFDRHIKKESYGFEVIYEEIDGFYTVLQVKSN